jgi:hypothetical protein
MRMNDATTTSAHPSLVTKRMTAHTMNNDRACLALDLDLTGFCVHDSVRTRRARQHFANPGLPPKDLLVQILRSSTLKRTSLQRQASDSQAGSVQRRRCGCLLYRYCEDFRIVADIFGTLHNNVWCEQCVGCDPST